jgi:phosphogluconate dehydratase
MANTRWRDAARAVGDDIMLRPPLRPVPPRWRNAAGAGQSGARTFKTSAVDKARWTIEAPARVFDDQNGVQAAFKAGELDRDVVVVVRFQGPRANGMPELHKLTPPLGVLQDKGFKVALVTDGRMSGASGKVPAAIHISPEALGRDPWRKLQDGDVVRCAPMAAAEVLADAAEWATAREHGPRTSPPAGPRRGPRTFRHHARHPPTERRKGRIGDAGGGGAMTCR